MEDTYTGGLCPFTGASRPIAGVPRVSLVGTFTIIMIIIWEVEINISSWKCSVINYSPLLRGYSL